MARGTISRLPLTFGSPAGVMTRLPCPPTVVGGIPERVRCLVMCDCETTGGGNWG
ncbi:hypothetical protein GSU3556 [Geobacter sulfurreducens PCA]|uniref:Uncharacterized protein n=1 Tax=Geobacter sulfurreducens (strain ATCC 51573 / DSM 12127 / PCA) TaxID=243231 RepID=I7FKB2_GEOSL|nr:hypothetical protein GSU3556 [Geobacter sulfurreducens PCA]HCD97602.1 hypothetical protein [Geobacter sulfurreducens]